eukprot:COSAG03_NODE_18174_length_360_cov_1.118774_1_plen_65_part_01
MCYRVCLVWAGLGGNYLSEIPYWVVLPKRSELQNLAAPVRLVAHTTSVAMNVGMVLTGFLDRRIA